MDLLLVSSSGPGYERVCDWARVDVHCAVLGASEGSFSPGRGRFQHCDILVGMAM